MLNASNYIRTKLVVHNGDKCSGYMNPYYMQYICGGMENVSVLLQPRIFIRLAVCFSAHF